MDIEDYESEMTKSGSIACLSKKTINNSLDCIISCTIFAALVYIVLTFLGIISVANINSLFLPVGYISLIVLLSAPAALYGSAKNSYCALFTFFVLASYHLYGLVIYVWLNIRSKSFLPPSGNNSTSSSSSSSLPKDYLLGELTLHEITLAAYALVVLLSLIMVCFKIVSATSSIEPARVILVDNNPE